MRAIDADAFKAYIRGACEEMSHVYKDGGKWAKQITEDFCMDIDEQPTIKPEPHWIPIKWHDCTDKDREEYGYGDDIVAVFDCEMPDDNQEILVTTSRGNVEKDVCYIDDGFSLDSGYDWIDDIKAWMPLPEPYGGNTRC